ncbi:MAG: hypothetical protein Q9160_004940 [Pyrenula sp. 1 TL-2023]
MGGFIIRFQDDIGDCNFVENPQCRDGSTKQESIIGNENDRENVEAQMTSYNVGSPSTKTLRTLQSNPSSARAEAPMVRETKDGKASKEDASSRKLPSEALATTEEPLDAISCMNFTCRAHEAALSSPLSNERSRRIQAAIDDSIHDKSSLGRSQQYNNDSTPEDIEYRSANQAMYLSRAKNWLTRLSITPDRGLEAYVLSENADAGAIGPTPWGLDSKNAATVKCALHEVDIDKFTSDWEKTRFLIHYRRIYSNLVVLQGNIWVLDACQLLLARRMGIITTLPSLPTDELNDRNKGDLLVKGVALGQILWSLVYVSMRSAEHNRGPSQLELIVLPFAICTSLTYALLCLKPQDVGTPTYINAHRRPTTTEMIRLSVNGPLRYERSLPRYWIPNNATHNDGCGPAQPHTRIALACFVAALIFGAVHCLAWNLHFPTTVERLLWRISAVLTALMPLLSYVTVLTLRWASFKSFPGCIRHLLASENMTPCVMYIFWLLYILARIYIVLEALRSLAFLAPETYLETWSVNLPHIG